MLIMNKTKQVSALEEEYDDIAKDALRQINNKIKEAGAKIQEARQLAKQLGYDLLTSYDDEFREFVYNRDYDDFDKESFSKKQLREYEFYHAVNIYPLFDEIDNAGWQTSTMTSMC